jgi:hypothetical protein
MCEGQWLVHNTTTPQESDRTQLGKCIAKALLIPRS